MNWQIDHLAIVGDSLAEATAWVQERLGTGLAPGGVHPHMGTHNRLLSLGPDAYLEAIAINPDVPPPVHARWFGMDWFSGPPRVQSWILRVDDMDAALAAAPKGCGKPIALSRADLRWQMAVPEDGLLPFDGVFPALIQWEGTAHPAPRLPEAECRLRMLILSHPEAEALEAALAPLGDPRLRVIEGEPRISASISTPRGEFWL